MLRIRRLIYVGFSFLLAGAIGAMAGTTLSCGAGILIGEASICQGIVYFWMFAIPVSSAATFFVGFPLYAVFKYFGICRWWQYAVAGVAIAAAVLLTSFVSGASWPFSSWPAMLQWVSIPVVAALALWLLLYELHGGSNGLAKHVSPGDALRQAP